MKSEKDFNDLQKDYIKILNENQLIENELEYAKKPPETNAELTQLIEEKNHRISELSSINKGLEELLDGGTESVNDDLNQVLAINSSLQDKINRLEKDKKTRETILIEKNQEIEDLVKSLAEKRDAAGMYMRLYDEGVDKISALEIRVKELLNETTQLKQKNCESEAQHESKVKNIQEESSKRINALQEELQKWKQQSVSSSESLYPSEISLPNSVIIEVRSRDQQSLPDSAIPYSELKQELQRKEIEVGNLLLTIDKLKFEIKKAEEQHKRSLDKCEEETKGFRLKYGKCKNLLKKNREELKKTKSSLANALDTIEQYERLIRSFNGDSSEESASRILNNLSMIRKED